MSRRRQLFFIFLAVCATLPGLYIRLASMDLSAPLTALLSGVAIMGASFLLLWACDAAQNEIPQALALAIVALIAVLPEYAVDIYFTWQAGQDPSGSYSHYAIANMTGANRLLIGIAWPTIALIFWIKTRRPVRLEPERRTELFFLGLATVYAFSIPIKGTLNWYDGVVLLAIYAWYIRLAGKRDVVESEAEGPAELLLDLPCWPRRLATAGMFLFSALVILANAQPFSEGLVATGKLWGINEFLLVQWLAPIASETPEFVVAIMFALRGQAGLSLGSLLSAKLNQWTLLVGMIPWVFALSSGRLHPALPMGTFQMNEVLLTAAQSLLGVILLATLRLSLPQAGLLVALFLGQLLSPGLVAQLPGGTLAGLGPDQMHGLFTVLYFGAAAALIAHQPARLRELWAGRNLAACRGHECEK
ncbi:MAG TPA: sodium:calcium antiporter [Armatimonadota bacterium]|jgi:cation:H+ antiporter